jgi:hypothetical protein
MIGRPKYKIGDKVSFSFLEGTKHGIIFIVDKYGTFEDDSDVSYDIMVEDTLYKHINEKFIKDYIE